MKTGLSSVPASSTSYTHLKFGCCCCFVSSAYLPSLFLLHVCFSNQKQPLCDIDTIHVFSLQISCLYLQHISCSPHNREYAHNREERGFLQQSLSCPLSLRLCPTFSTCKAKWCHSPFFFYNYRRQSIKTDRAMALECTEGRDASMWRETHAGAQLRTHTKPIQAACAHWADKNNQWARGGSVTVSVNVVKFIHQLAVRSRPPQHGKTIH